MQPDPRYIDCPEYPTGTVILVSGGVDSLINADTTPGILLFVDFHSDARNEWRACRELFNQERELHSVAIRPQWSSANGFFVPSRNLMLATMAIPYGSDIVMGAMKDDHSTDKTPEAIEAMSAILTAQAGRPITVRAPLNHLYKFEAVKLYATTPLRVSRMRNTWSCYTTRSTRCYDCKACFRWSVALNWAGIEVPKPSKRIAQFYLSQLELFDKPEQDAFLQVCG